MKSCLSVASFFSSVVLHTSPGTKLALCPVAFSEDFIVSLDFFGSFFHQGKNEQVNNPQMNKSYYIELTFNRKFATKTISGQTSKEKEAHQNMKTKEKYWPKPSQKKERVEWRVVLAMKKSIII